MESLNFHSGKRIYIYRFTGGRKKIFFDTKENMNATFKKNDRVRVLKVGGQMNKFAIVKGMCMNDTRVLVTMEEDGDVKSYLEEELALSTVLDRSLTYVFFRVRTFTNSHLL